MPKHTPHNSRKQTPEHVEKRVAAWKETVRDHPELVSSEVMSARARKHGMHGTRTYQSWISMRQRCLNPNHTAYHNYGGRGIRICPRWDSFENFYADMGERPDGHSIDRIDSDGDYEPKNCRWSPAVTQSRNWSRANHRVTYNGQTLTLAEWSEQVGIEHHTLQYRIRKGWSIEEALTTPVRGRKG